MEKLKYRRCEIVIKYEDGDKKIEAYELASSPEGGLVAHRGRGMNGWVITHKKSGLMVHPFSNTLQEALARIKRLYEVAQEEGFSWNDSAEELRRMDSSSKLKVKKILIGD